MHSAPFSNVSRNVSLNNVDLEDCVCGAFGSPDNKIFYFNYVPLEQPRGGRNPRINRQGALFNSIMRCANTHASRTVHFGESVSDLRVHDSFSRSLRLRLGEALTGAIITTRFLGGRGPESGIACKSRVISPRFSR